MSEQYSLKWPQVDFELQQLYLSRTKNGDPRDVPLNGTALQALEQLRSESQGDFVFPDAESPRGWFFGRGRAGGPQELYLALQSPYLRQ